MSSTSCPACFLLSQFHPTPSPRSINSINALSRCASNPFSSSSSSSSFSASSLFSASSFTPSIHALPKSSTSPTSSTVIKRIRISSSNIDDANSIDGEQPLPSPLPSIPNIVSSSRSGNPSLDTLNPNNGTTSSSSSSSSSLTSAASLQQQDRFKVQRRVAVGFIMGAVVIIFVFSPTVIFALGMLMISLIGLYEYYRMVTAKGHLPAYKMGLGVTTATMLLSALIPSLADVSLPVGATCICIYLLFRRSKIATIADISTTFMGLFYAGYLPSYWVRLHSYHIAYDNNLLMQITYKILSRFGQFSLPNITIGSLLVFWTWLALASADIGAFFFGRMYGKTRFSNISPKKTVEGAIAGFVCSASISILGAFLLNWPIWYVTGPVYGFTIGVLGLCGDLFESCFKRDVGWKDSGQLFPGHGGMLDRADSYVLVAPLVYYFATLVLPWITRMVR